MATSPGHDRRPDGDPSARPPTRRAVSAALLSAVALGVAGCSSSGRTAAPADRPTPTPSPEPTPTPTPEPARWPLTGIEVDGDVPDRPALSVKIENSPEARPQTGLDQADVVFEELVEGGITRFNAVYHSVVPGELGPIRSIRPMDAAIAGPFGGMLAFSGGQPGYVSRAQDAGLTVASFDAGDAGFFRLDGRVAPHNVYGRGEDLLAQARGAAGPPEEILAFAAEADAASATAGTTTDRISLTFPAASPGWRWEPRARLARAAGTGAWRRTEDGRAQSTADGRALRAANVVVLRVQVRGTGRLDAAGSPVPETVLTGEGDGVVFSRGHAAPIRWAKGRAAGPLELRGDDGEPVRLAPGPTWIELLPRSAGLAY